MVGQMGIGGVDSFGYRHFLALRTWVFTRLRLPVFTPESKSCHVSLVSGRQCSEPLGLHCAQPLRVWPAHAPTSTGQQCLDCSLAPA